MDHIDFGRFLTQQRELRGLSRDEVAQATKIPPTLIAALETGQVERLPARIFVLNYIRAYAQVIGMEPEEAVLRYEEMDKTVPSEPPPAALEHARRTRAWVGLALTLVLAALIVGGLLLASGKLGHPFGG
ncbi:helix-turn-helix domain-containing protein [Aggregicoccus sp. 17bor-14]|uniref:helix-turn-helix domain-containing protein n=1 Tax=Myxococcaceae TaxID=31 RepID=UPI0012EFD810|nr:helix-turn-helix domain-containing protein [Simulacricoccus sp. 17bor-14]MRI86954.1 helix-turn-helix domain-containing protein [Aggregicoccus sp. 17bor-14]